MIPVDMSMHNNILKSILLSYLIAPLMKLDITAMPIPLPDTINISTNSRLRLKYCATIKVEQSLVMPTPIPEKVKIKVNSFTNYLKCFTVGIKHKNFVLCLFKII